MTDIAALKAGLLADIEGAGDLARVEELRVGALGKQGVITALLKTLGKMTPDERQQRGPVIHDLRQGVTDALLILGEGFIQHPANNALRNTLHNGELSKEAYFQQLLRLIYRLIFIFSVEERGLLHPKDNSKAAQAARRAYAEGYALARLRELTGGYQAPVDACATFQALYEALPALESDLHEHIHLENNILFPRSIEQEERQMT